MKFHTLDRIFIGKMNKWGIPLLRFALGIVFLWFGALKIFGVSPVTELVSGTYSFFPQQEFIFVLGLWEVVVGLGLVTRRFLRCTLGLLWLQMGGTLFALLLSPALFFLGGNVLLLTVLGEFVVKNLVLIAAGIVIGGHEVRARC